MIRRSTPFLSQPATIRIRCWRPRHFPAGKHVAVEKPLAVDEQGLERVRQAYTAQADKLLIVGFNRRFARIL